MRQGSRCFHRLVVQWRIFCAVSHWARSATRTFSCRVAPGEDAIAVTGEDIQDTQERRQTCHEETERGPRVKVREQEEAQVPAEPEDLPHAARGVVEAEADRALEVPAEAEAPARARARVAKAVEAGAPAEAADNRPSCRKRTRIKKWR